MCYGYLQLFATHCEFSFLSFVISAQNVCLDLSSHTFKHGPRTPDKVFFNNIPNIWVNNFVASALKVIKEIKKKIGKHFLVVKIGCHSHFYPECKAPLFTSHSFTNSTLWHIWKNLLFELVPRCWIQQFEFQLRLDLKIHTEHR